jgi:hypothetical protein
MEEGIEEGGQMHKGLETTYSCELQGLEGWGEEKPKGVKACHGGCFGAAFTSVDSGAAEAGGGGDEGVARREW